MSHYNILKIAEGWYNYVVGSEETKARMKHRLSICDTCPNKVALGELGQAITNIVSKDYAQVVNFKCNLCGCPFGPLTSSKTSECQAKKW